VKFAEKSYSGGDRTVFFNGTAQTRILSKLGILGVRKVNNVRNKIRRRSAGVSRGGEGTM
jgi:hypothetical protein